MARLPFFVLFAAAVLSLFAWQSGANRGAVRFEYCTLYMPSGYYKDLSGGVKGTYETEVWICYAEAAGCRWEQLTLQGPNTERGSVRGYNWITGKALYKLGQDGWELVGSGLHSAPESATPRQDVLYFKRSLTKH